MIENMLILPLGCDKVTQKTYTSGREIKPGDIILFAILQEEGKNDDFICLHEEELNEYEYMGEGKDIAPKIRKKQFVGAIICGCSAHGWWLKNEGLSCLSVRDI